MNKKEEAENALVECRSHTPEAELINVQGTEQNGTVLLVKVFHPTPMNAVERARLYEAAPQLLAAVKEILPFLEHEKVHNGDGYDCQGWRAETVDACTCRVSVVIAAIAQAEGRAE